MTVRMSLERLDVKADENISENRISEFCSVKWTVTWDFEQRLQLILSKNDFIGTYLWKTMKYSQRDGETSSGYKIDTPWFYPQNRKLNLGLIAYNPSYAEEEVHWPANMVSFRKVKDTVQNQGRWCLKNDTLGLDHKTPSRELSSSLSFSFSCPCYCSCPSCSSHVFFYSWTSSPPLTPPSPPLLALTWLGHM